MSKLKRCPFCGGKSRYLSKTKKFTGCDKCQQWKEIKRWNTRPLEDELLKALIEIKSHISEESKRKLPLSHIIADICDPIIKKHTSKPIDEVVK